MPTAAMKNLGPSVAVVPNRRNDHEPDATPREAEDRRRLRIASFNIQTGITTASYRDYFTGSWRHLLPTSHRLVNLDRIAHLLRPFDIVGLQEVDGGGSRSRNVIQTHYLAERAGFAYWHNQVNRRFGDLALHSNGLLSRVRPDALYDLKLPGLPGRGAVLVRFSLEEHQALYLCILHLALSRRGRLRQLAFISEWLRGQPNVILMGDLNCEPDTPELRLLTQRTELCEPACELKTYPSWRPRKMLDYILVTPTLKVEHLRVVNFACSDHLPVAMDVYLPVALKLPV